MMPVDDLDIFQFEFLRWPLVLLSPHMWHIAVVVIAILDAFRQTGRVEDEAKRARRINRRAKVSIPELCRLPPLCIDFIRNILRYSGRADTQREYKAGNVSPKMHWKVRNAGKEHEGDADKESKCKHVGVMAHRLLMYVQAWDRAALQKDFALSIMTDGTVHCMMERLETWDQRDERLVGKTPARLVSSLSLVQVPRSFGVIIHWLRV